MDRVEKLIAAEFKRNDDGRILFRIAGHSTYAAKGKDVVCAAVSGIAYALVGYLRCFKSEESRIIRFTSGILELDCSDECNEVLQMACVGLSRIAFTYPDQVSLKNRVWYKLIEKNEKG